MFHFRLLFQLSVVTLGRRAVKEAEACRKRKGGAHGYTAGILSPESLCDAEQVIGTRCASGVHYQCIPHFLNAQFIQELSSGCR